MEMGQGIHFLDSRRLNPNERPHITTDGTGKKI
jgi:hypothetical protein